MNEDIKKYGTHFDIERREKLQKILFQLYEEDLKTGKNKKKSHILIPNLEKKLT